MDTKIIRQGSFEAFYDMPLFVNWLITEMCNYQCSYCFGQKKIDKSKFTTFEQLKTAIDNILYLNRPLYDFTFSGGEPTIHPELFNLLTYINNKIGDKLNQITFVTNGSRTGNFYDKLVEVSKKVKMNFVISIHTDHVNKNHIYDLIKTFSNDIYITFNLMYNPDKQKLVKEIFKDLLELRKKYPFSLNIKTLRQPPDYSIPDSRYTEEDFRWQYTSRSDFLKLAKDNTIIAKRKNKKEINFFRDIIQDNEYKQIINGDRDKQFNTGLCNFAGMYCVAGVNMIRINPNGMTKGVICPSEVHRYNIYQKDAFKNLDFMHLVHCKEKNCGCVANDPLPKFKSKIEAENFLSHSIHKQEILINAKKGKNNMKNEIIKKTREEIISTEWKNSDYYEKAEKSLDIFWNRQSPFNFLFSFLDKTEILELSCGHGRHVGQYQNQACKITLVDVNIENINFCKERFKNCEFENKISYYLTKGCDFKGIENESVTSVFSYDSMVHFEVETIIDYLKETNRILKSGCYALFHHSNSPYSPGSFYRKKPHARNFMSMELFAHLCLINGLEPVMQIVLPWGRGENKVFSIDGISLVKKN